MAEVVIRLDRGEVAAVYEISGGIGYRVYVERDRSTLEEIADTWRQSGYMVRLVGWATADIDGRPVLRGLGSRAAVSVEGGVGGGDHILMRDSQKSKNDVVKGYKKLIKQLEERRDEYLQRIADLESQNDMI